MDESKEQTTEVHFYLHRVADNEFYAEVGGLGNFLVDNGEQGKQVLIQTLDNLLCRIKAGPLMCPSPKAVQ